MRNLKYRVSKQVIRVKVGGHSEHGRRKISFLNDLIVLRTSIQPTFFLASGNGYTYNVRYKMAPEEETEELVESPDARSILNSVSPLFTTYFCVNIYSYNLNAVFFDKPHNPFFVYSPLLIAFTYYWPPQFYLVSHTQRISLEILKNDPLKRFCTLCHALFPSVTARLLISTSHSVLCGRRIRNICFDLCCNIVFTKACIPRSLLVNKYKKTYRVTGGSRQAWIYAIF